MGVHFSSVRVLARSLGTSPSQVVRLLKGDRSAKQLAQLCRLAEAAGCRLEITLHENGGCAKKRAAERGRRRA